MYYKVLLDGKSFHGGEFEWSLPKNGKPGKWHSVVGDLRMCLHGFHLTDNPQKWWNRDAKCYEVEYKDALQPNEDKICVRKVRLVKELTHDDLAKLQIFYSGEHVVTEGTALAYNSSTVKAYGSSTVKACDSSSVKAYGSSTVTAYNSSTVEAHIASTVTACDSSTVTAYNSSTVKACGSSTVEACDSSSVEACGSSTVNSRFHTGNVTVSHNAIHINRDTTPPTIRGNYQGGK